MTKALAKIASSVPARRVFSVDDASRGRLMVRATYDVARTTEENASLWKYVDSLSAAAANNPAVRKTIRERARYEAANNSFASGILATLANDVVGPVVQLQLGDSDLAEQAENDFAHWSAAMRLWKKCRTMRKVKGTDGEIFGLFVTNKNLNDIVKLDIRLVECDQIESWYSTVFKENEVDGVRFDENGDPTHYRLLKYHPGDYRGFTGNTGEWIPRKYMLHYFTEIRPGQVRGVSDLLPSLTLFGQLRKYTTAVIETATRAAEIAGIMWTDLLPDQVAAELADPVTIMDIERNAIMSLPEGWKLTQLKSEQPTTMFKEFRGEIINEIARPLSMPYNVATCNSSAYNYASGRLDHQTYDKAIEVERADLCADVLDRVYYAWLDEYAARKGLSKAEKTSLEPHAWFFTGRDHVDPSKESNADDLRLKNGSLTYSRYYSKKGIDWKRETKQGVTELVQRELMWNEARASAGLPPLPYPYQQNAQPQQPPAPGEDEDSTPINKDKKNEDEET